MREATALPLVRSLLRGLIGPLVAGLLLALLGPFGTHGSQALPERIAFWLIVVAGNWLLCHLAILWLDARWPRDRPTGWPGPAVTRRLLLPLAASLMVLLPATALVRLAGDLFGGVGATSLALLAAQVYLLCATLSLLGYGFAELQEQAATPEQDPTQEAAPPIPPGPAPDAAFRRRLSPDPGGRLLWLRSEDHYLRVHCEAGEALILCRLEDAAHELAGCGRRVHRSWWVAEAALDRDRGTQARLRLVDGSDVPVGRTYRKQLVAAGWLPGRAS